MDLALDIKGAWLVVELGDIIIISDGMPNLLKRIRQHFFFVGTEDSCAVPDILLGLGTSGQSPVPQEDGFVDPLIE